MNCFGICKRLFVGTSVLGLVLLAQAAASAGIIVLAPTETVTVPAATPASPGSTSGDIVIRERASDSAEFQRHISAFLNFDLSGVTGFNPGGGDKARFAMTFQDQLNTSNNAALYVGQITGGAWSTSSLPQYNWATKSGATVGPGSQTRDAVVIDNVMSASPGDYSADISGIVDAWINGGESNYGLGVYLASNSQGAGFTAPSIQVDIAPHGTTVFFFSSSGNAGSQLTDMGASPQTATVGGMEIEITAVGIVSSGIRVGTAGIGPHGGGAANTMQPGESFTFVFDQNVSLVEFLLDGGAMGAGSNPPGGSLTVDLPGTANDVTIDTSLIDGPFSLGNVRLSSGDPITLTANTGFGASFASLTVQRIPEPSTFVLAALGLLGLGFCGRRRER